MKIMQIASVIDQLFSKTRLSSAFAPVHHLSFQMVNDLFPHSI